jgi:hypothetical protein
MASVPTLKANPVLNNARDTDEGDVGRSQKRQINKVNALHSVLARHCREAVFVADF